MKIFVINGPNINMLGIREKNIYGDKDYNSLLRSISQHASEIGVEVDFFQSNSEGDIVTAIQNCYGVYDGIVINPAAYTHTSVAILDALKAVQIPTVEVHISAVEEREEFRRISYVKLFAFKTITGKGFAGYSEALDELKNKLSKGV